MPFYLMYKDKKISSSRQKIVFFLEIIFKNNIDKKKFINFVKIFGGLAQLARAFGWQPKGHRFESGSLHKISLEFEYRARRDKEGFVIWALNFF